MPEEKDNCPYNEKSLATFSNDKRASEEQLAEWKLIPRNFITNLWKKNYHWHDILQLRKWKLEEKEIPDLTSQERMGVINGLIVMPNPKLFDSNVTDEEKEKIMKETGLNVGRTTDLVITVRKIPSGCLKVNIDRGCSSGGEENEKSDRGQVQKIVKLAFQQENINPSQYEVSVLWAIGAHRFGNEWDINCGNSHGSSGGSAIYLALLSALHQKPISHSVAATGTLIMQEQRGKVNNQEIILAPGTNLPITGLKEKVAACAEKEINRIVLSKYQTAPLLSSWDKGQKKWIQNEDDYQTVVPTETKTKIKEVHWTENISELRDLIFSGRLS